jgi:hypothetical protein
VSFLLDTNALSEIRKKTPDAGVAAWFASVPADRLFLSVLVAGEIRQAWPAWPRGTALKHSRSSTGSAS